MKLPNYNELLPDADETNIKYCRRLEAKGYDEMRIRMALRLHFEMEINEFAEFFEGYEIARLRYLSILNDMAPNRSDYAFAVNVSKSLGLSQDRAEHWVSLFRRSREKLEKI